MKKIASIFLLAIALVLFSFNKKDEAVFYAKDHFKNEKWYAAMITKLNKEDRADAASAHWIQILSSSSYIASEKSMPKLIEMLGKIDESEIRSFFKENEKDTSVFIFVETLNNIHHLFIFNTETEELKRVQNSGTIVITGVESVILKENNKEGILFYANTKSGSSGNFSRKHFYFNRQANSFQHIKTCNVIKDVEQCKAVNN